MAKILIAPDSFKGSATSAQVAHTLAEGWKIVRPYDEIVIAPFADGGEGTLDCIESVTPGSMRIPITVQGATGIERQSSWLLVGGDTAVIEMATLCGITTVDQLDPLGAHSFGLGQAIKAALEDDQNKEFQKHLGIRSPAAEKLINQLKTEQGYSTHYNLDETTLKPKRKPH